MEEDGVREPLLNVNNVYSKYGYEYRVKQRSCETRKLSVTIHYTGGSCWKAAVRTHRSSPRVIYVILRSNQDSRTRSKLRPGRALGVKGGEAACESRSKYYLTKGSMRICLIQGRARQSIGHFERLLALGNTIHFPLEQYHSSVQTEQTTRLAAKQNPDSNSWDHAHTSVHTDESGLEQEWLSPKSMINGHQNAATLNDIIINILWN